MNAPQDAVTLPFLFQRARFLRKECAATVLRREGAKFLYCEQERRGTKPCAERAVHPNFIANDVPGHDAILHKAFICISPTGARISRADYLKAWATGFDPERIPTGWHLEVHPGPDHPGDPRQLPAGRNDRQKIPEGPASALAGSP